MARQKRIPMVEQIVKLLFEIAHHSFIVTLAVIAVLAIVALVGAWRG